MDKTWKRIAAIAAGAFGVLLAGVLVLQIKAQTSNDADKQALRQIKAAYETAVNSDDMSALAPYVSASFSGTVATGQQVQSFDEFKAYWKTMKELVGIAPNRRGKYTCSMEPVDTFFLNDYAFSFGTSKETLITDVPNGESRESHHYHFNSNWYALSVKENGQWKLLNGRVVVDPFHTTFSEKKISDIAALATDALKKAASTP